MHNWYKIYKLPLYDLLNKSFSLKELLSGDHMAEIFYEFTHVHAYTYGKSQICLSPPPPPTRKNKIISRTTPPWKN